MGCIGRRNGAWETDIGDSTTPSILAYHVVLHCRTNAGIEVVLACFDTDADNGDDEEDRKVQSVVSETTI